MNYMEFQTEDGTILVNLDNVSKIYPYENKTTIVFNSSKGDGSQYAVVDESYQEVKKKLGL